MRLEEKLVSLRKRKGLTQLKVAETIHVSRQAISRWEVGDAVPSIENFKALAKLYGVSLEYLLSDDENAFSSEVKPEEAGEISKPIANKRDSGSEMIYRWIIGILVLLLLFAAGYILVNGEQEEDYIWSDNLQKEVVEIDPNLKFEIKF